MTGYRCVARCVPLAACELLSHRGASLAGRQRGSPNAQLVLKLKGRGWARRVCVAVFVDISQCFSLFCPLLKMSVITMYLP